MDSIAQGRLAAGSMAHRFGTLAARCTGCMLAGHMCADIAVAVVAQARSKAVADIGRWWAAVGVAV